MSINISAVSNKPEFINHFSEPITLPVNAEVSMIKANIDVPLNTMIAATVPFVAVGDRTNVCLNVSIDGIERNITWNDLYTAHTEFAAVDIDAGVTAGEYFGGAYQYFPYNNPIFNDAGLTLFSKIQFPHVLAKAIDNQYEFYDIIAELKYETKDDANEINVSNNLVTRNFTTLLGLMQSNFYKEWALVATYLPQKNIANASTTANVFDATDVANWALSAGNNTITSTNAGQNVCYNNNTSIISVNGGYQSTEFTHTAGVCAFGISFVGVGEGTDKWSTYNATYAPSLFDVGFEFEENANPSGAEKVYRIIDGSENFVYYDTGIPARVEVNKPLFRPAQSRLKYNNGDSFFIQVLRGNLYNGTTEFVVNLYQGQNNGTLASATTKLIYTARRTLNNSAVRPQIGWFSTADVGNIFQNNNFIPQTIQDVLQNQANVINEPSGQKLGTMSLEPIIIQDLNLGRLERDFWTCFVYFSCEIDVNDSNIRSSIESQDQVITMTLQTNINSSVADIYYYLGQQDIRDMLILDPNTNCLAINKNSIYALKNLPKEFKVAINNLPIKYYQGIFNSRIVGGDGQSGGGLQRTIGTIPLPGNVSLTDTEIEINYEPVNATYKPLNNGEPFACNQLFYEIFFHDYDTNLRKKFAKVNGFLTVDVNLRQGAKPPLIQNNLRTI